MIFRQIKLNNFRQFKGENCLKFETDGKRNVTLVLGENGAGKTTLLQAFNWCLYDKANLDGGKLMLNKEVSAGLNVGETALVEVEIIFEHLDKVYKCRNYAVYEKQSGEEPIICEKNQVFTFVDSSGQTREASSNTIREIFPSDLSYYFLFDGERMQELSNNDSRGRKDLSHAVKNLMGLEMLETAKKHLKSVGKKFEEELVSDNSTRLDEINAEIKDLYSKKVAEERKKEEYEKEKDELEKQLDDVGKFLKSKTQLKELQEKREAYDKQVTIVEKAIEEKKGEIFRLFGEKSPRFFCGEKLVELRGKLKRSNLRDKGIEGINGGAIQQLLDSHYCICGTDLEENPNARARLEELRKYLPPESYATLLKALEVTMDNAESSNKDFYNRMAKLYDDYSKLQSDKDVIQQEKEENEKLINDIGDQDLAEKNNEYTSLREQVSSKDQAIGSCKHAIELAVQTIHARENERTNIATKNEFNKKIQYKVEVCKKLVEKIDEELNNKETVVRERLQEKTSYLLGKMLRSDKKIIIEDDYNFTIIDRFGPSLLGEGEKIVTSFAFVGSLISVAKTIMNERLGEENDSRFTLVMDAPFAKLDRGHRKNVTEEIPSLTDQIILFTVDSQYDDIVKATLEDKVFNSYEIIKESNTLSRIKENK